MSEEETPKKVARTSANSEPKAGMLVTCCADRYRLTHFHDGKWWGANLGPKGEHHTKMIGPVPRPFLFIEEDE
jgi:hypothetical protein